MALELLEPERFGRARFERTLFAAQSTRLDFFFLSFERDNIPHAIMTDVHPAASWYELSRETDCYVQ